MCCSGSESGLPHLKQLIRHSYKHSMPDGSSGTRCKMTPMHTAYHSRCCEKSYAQLSQYQVLSVCAIRCLALHGLRVYLRGMQLPLFQGQLLSPAPARRAPSVTTGRRRVGVRIWKLSDTSYETSERAKGAGSLVTCQRLTHACGLCDVRSSVSR